MSLLITWNTLPSQADRQPLLSASTMLVSGPMAEIWLCTGAGCSSFKKWSSQADNSTLCCAGDLSRVQGLALAAGSSSSAAPLAALSTGASRRKGSDTAHLEANMAAALLLQSQQEYRRWLITYVRHLAGTSHRSQYGLCERLCSQGSVLVHDLDFCVITLKCFRSTALLLHQVV